MKKRILYIILGVMLLSLKGVGQGIFDVANLYYKSPSTIGNCTKVKFHIENTSSTDLISYEILHSVDGGVSYTNLTLIAYGIAQDLNPLNSIEPIFTTSGYYKAIFTNGGTTTTTSPIYVTVNNNPTIITTGSISALCYSISAQSATLSYTATTYSPTSYTVDWNPAANTAGLSDQTLTSASFSSGGGNLATINIPSSVLTGTYNGTMIISNSNGCTNNTAISILIKPLPIVTFDVNANAQECQNSEITYTTQSGKSNYLWSTSEIPNFDYVITNGGLGVSDNTVRLKWLRTGTKTLQVNYTDANMCSAAVPQTSSTLVNPIPTVATITPQIKCNSLASDVINFSGTVTGTTYAWTNSQSTIGIAGSGSGTISSTTLINLTSSPIIGTFTVTPTANSCPGPAGTFTITVNPTPTVAAITPQIKCNTVASDIINFSGTVTGTTYAWTNSQSSIGITASGSGTISSTILRNLTTNPVIGIFTVIPTANSCPGPAGTFTITVNPTPTVAAITPQIKCNTVASDIINFSGTVTGTTYAWTNSQSSIGIAASGSGTISSTILRNLTTNPVIGTFTVTPTANSCPGPAGTFTITVNPTPTVTAITPQIKCNTVASDIINFSGTVTGTTYAWTNSQSSIGITASGSGTISSTILRNLTTNPVVGIFTVTPTSNSCAGPVGTFTITVNPLPTTPTLTSSTICEGQSTVVSMSAPTGTYTYTWLVPTGVATSTTSSVTTTKAGTYSLTITNANNCTSAIGTGTVVVNPKPTTPSLTSSTICEGQSTSISMSAPTGTYTYTWLVPTGVATSTTSSVTTTKAGTYSLTITNANNCTSAIGTGTVVVNPRPTTPTLTSSIICEGQSTSISMSAPAGTYSYTWLVPSGVATSTTSSVTTTKAGTYSLTITNVNNCTSAIGTGAVIVKPKPTTPILTSPIICEGQSTSISMSAPAGTYTYTWQVPTGVATSTTSSVTTTKAGTYSLTITNANNCTSAIGTGTVTVNPLPTTPTLTSSTICEGESTIVSMSAPTGTYTYTWQVPTGVTTSTTSSVTTTKAGTYSLTITNANNCTSAIGTGTVVINPKPTTPTLTSSIICEGQSTSISMSAPTGTYSYTWLVPSGVATSTTSSVTTTKAGTYSLTITNENNCSSEVGIGIVTVNPLPATPTLTSSTICEGQSTSVSMSAPSGIYTYTWQVATGVTTSTTSSVTTTKAGTYSLTITNANNCTSEVGIGTVVVNPKPTTPTLTSSTICEGQSTSVSMTAPTGTYTYTWQVPSGVATSTTSSLTTTKAGTYSLTITNSNACTSDIGTGTVVVNTLPVAGNITGTNAVCVGLTTPLSTNVTGGSGTISSTSWLSSAMSKGTIDKDGVVTGVAGGSTSITYNVTDSKGCVSSPSAPFAITVNALPVAGTITGAIAVCVKLTTPLSIGTITGSLGNIISTAWLSSATSKGTINSSGVVTGVSAGTTSISYTVTDDKGCVSSPSAPFAITINALPNVSLVASKSKICLGESMTLKGDGASTYVWDNGVTNGNEFTPTITQTFRVTGTDINGCVNTASIKIPVYAIPKITQISAVANNIMVGSDLILNHSASNGLPPYNYKWEISDPTVAGIYGAFNPTLSGIKVGSVAVKYYVIDANACSSLTSNPFNVNIIPAIMKFEMPNAFIPTDRYIENKFLRPSYNTSVKHINYFRVFNRMGILVYEIMNADPSAIKWDGKFNNVMQESDGYMWIAEYTGLGEVSLERKSGQFLLLK